MEFEEAKKHLSAQFNVIADTLNDIVQNLKLKPDSKLLDIGTGRGLMAITLALNNYKVITGEPEDDESIYAKKDWQNDAKKVGIDHLITFKHFNADNLPFDDISFDAVFIYGSFHHIESKYYAVKECLRVLKKKGSLCIIEPSEKMIKRIRKINPDHPDAVDPRNFIKELPLSVEIIEKDLANAYILKLR
jgi:ubiquinone/menaquinone biosynthesis C-methylase UbiE